MASSIRISDKAYAYLRHYQLPGEAIHKTFDRMLGLPGEAPECCPQCKSRKVKEATAACGHRFWACSKCEERGELFITDDGEMAAGCPSCLAIEEAEKRHQKRQSRKKK